VKPHLNENDQNNPTHQKEKKISDFVSFKIKIEFCDGLYKLTCYPSNR